MRSAWPGFRVKPPTPPRRASTSRYCPVKRTAPAPSSDSRSVSPLNPAISLDPTPCDTNSFRFGTVRSARTSFLLLPSKRVLFSMSMTSVSPRCVVVTFDT